MSSVPLLAQSHKARWWQVRGPVRTLVVFAAGALFACAVWQPQFWAYWKAEAEQDTAEFEAAARSAVVAGQEAATEAARTRAEMMLDLKEHPERYSVRWEHTYQPTKKDLDAMADFGGARGQQDIATAYSGSLRVLNTSAGYYVQPSPIGDTDQLIGLDATYDPPQAAGAVSSCGGSVTVAPVLTGLGGRYWFAGDAASAEGEKPAGYGENVQWVGAYVAFKVTGSAPSASDEILFGVWVADLWTAVPTDPAYVQTGGDGATVTWAVALTGAYRKAKITESIPADQAYLRHTAQRTGTGHWFADADTEVTVTATVAGESLSATGNYGAGGEVDLTETLALGVTPSISLNYAPDPHTDYATVTVNAGADVPLDFTNWTFFKTTDNTAWHWCGDTQEDGYDPTPDAGDVLWYTQPSGNTISLRAGDAYTSGAAGFSALTAFVACDLHLRLWKQNKEAMSVTGSAGVERYTVYDTSEGHPFEVYRYRTSEQTDADVSCAPDWTDPIQIRETWTFAEGGIPDDKWRFLTNTGDGIRVALRKDWMEANNEDVVYTEPLTTKDLPRTDPETLVYYPLTDIRQVLTFHPLDGELDDPPWRDDWITWVRTERNLDQPTGATSRPSPWTGVGAVDVTGEVWTIPAGGGTVERTLATRRRNRIGRMNAHLWTGSGDQQEVSDYWPLMTRANLPILTTGDDVKWWDPLATPWPGEEVGVEFEDVTDWRNLSCVELTCTGVSADQTVTLRITYRTLSGTNPYYTGARWKYGTADGEFEATWSEQQTADITATLYASTGKAKFDLAPDSPNAPLDLELVEKVEFLFSAEDTVTFSAWATVPYSGEGSGEQRMRMAHKHSSDYWGAGHWVDGMPNYQPTYLSPFASDRVEVGYYSTQDAQHNPDSELTTDLRSLKSLSAWVTEQLWAETLLEPTWETANVEAALTDVDDVDLAAPMWGDYDEDGFALHVGTDLDCFFPLHTVYCDVIRQGGARGIAKTGGVRKVSEADLVTLQYSDDGGTTLVDVATADTDAQGMFRIGTGREKTPRVYYLKAGPTYYIGGFVNAEEVWYGASKLTGYPQDICQDEHDRTWGLLYDTAGAVVCKGADMGRVQPIWEDATAPFGTATTYERPRITCGPRGRLVAAATDTAAGNQMVIAVSDDMGSTWQAIAGSVLSNLQYGDVAIGEHDELAVCGWHDDAIWFRLTTQTDHTADDLTATETELQVCAAVVGEQDTVPWSIVERATRGIWAVLVEGAGLYVVQCYGVGFVEVTGPHIADGLVYVDLAISEQDELGCVGYDAGAQDVLFRATTAADWTADPLNGAVTELVVADASTAQDGPFCSLAAVGRGAWVAGVDDGTGELQYYRLRSPQVGFEECSA